MSEERNLQDVIHLAKQVRKIPKELIRPESYAFDYILMLNEIERLEELLEYKRSAVENEA